MLAMMILCASLLVARHRPTFAVPKVVRPNSLPDHRRPSRLGSGLVT